MGGPVELGREESGSRLEDFVGPAKLGHLALEALDLCRLVGRRAWALAGVDLSLADPFTNRLGGAHAQLLRDRTDGGPLRVVVRGHLGDRPHRPLTQLRRVVLVPTCHDSISSEDRVSGHAGGLQTARWARSGGSAWRRTPER